MAFGNVLTGLGKMVPANQKAAFNKDAAKAMEVMNKLTGGPGGKSAGVQNGDDDIGDGYETTTPPVTELKKADSDDGAKNLDKPTLEFTDMTAFGDIGPPVVRTLTKNTTKTAAIIKENALHQYATYTYHAELFILSVNDYNSFIEDEKWKIEDQPGRLLIKSGGGNQKNRNKYFKLDYFIDNIDIDSKIAPAAGNGGSTNTAIEFTITEPYGMTLLNGLVMACRDAGGFNYTDQPYLLKMSFKGFDSNGVIIESGSPETTRYIPIKITKFTFGATEAGTTYQVTAVPYHDMGLENTKATIKTDIRIDAGTVGSFLHNSIQTVSTFSVPGEQKDLSDFASKALPVITQKIDIVNGGLAGYFNLIEAEHVKQGTKQHADVYNFKAHPDISSAMIIMQDVVEIRKIKNENDPRKKALGQFQQNFEYNETTQHFSIRAGTNILQVLHSIIKTCSYLTNQVKADNLQKVPNKQFSKYEDNESTPINFYRIVPVVKLLEKWDTKRNVFAREITFVIKKYNMYGKDYENFGQAPVQEVVKDYNYLYTGQNNDILNFDIQFNSAYYQKNLYQIAEKAKTSTTDKAFFQPSDFYSGNLALTDANALSVIAPYARQSSIETGSSKGISDPRSNPRAMIVDNFMQDVFKTGADLMEISLEIIGDPAFIHQHDMRTVALMTSEAGLYFEADRSLNPDREWHLSLSFKNPVDINTETGLYSGFGHDEDGLAEVTAPTMNGIYKAVEVTSKFAGGKFTQSIKAIRERGKQITDFVEASEATKSTDLRKIINKKVSKLEQKQADPIMALKKYSIPSANDLDKTITGSNAVQSAIAKAGSLGKAFPPGFVPEIGEIQAISGTEAAWEPPASMAKTAGGAILKSARKILT